jgi:outer membrane immunogenic protein
LALAADIAVKAPPPAPAPVCIWCGFYVGLSAGYGWSRDNVDPVGTVTGTGGGSGPIIAAAQVAAIPSTLSTNANGFIGGGQIGWNWQWYQFAVLGVEADFSGLAGKGSNSFTTFVPFVGAEGIASTTSVDRRLEFLGTVRGRIGFALDRLLIFGTGGYAFGHAQSSTTITQSCNDGCALAFSSPALLGSENLGGWAAGGGMEYSFGFWSVKAEYLHYDLGHMNYAPTTISVSNGATPSTTINVASTANFKGDLVRVGLNYQFHPQ